MAVIFPNSSIPFGRKREQDLCAQRRAVYPRKAIWQKTTKEKSESVNWE